jgi:hypothetical protein
VWETRVVRSEEEVRMTENWNNKKTAKNKSPHHPRPAFGTNSFIDMKKMFFCFFFVLVSFHYSTSLLWFWWTCDELTTQDTTHMHWISLHDGFLTLFNVSAINNQHPGEVCNIITTQTQEALIFGHRWSSSSSGGKQSSHTRFPRGLVCSGWLGVSTWWWPKLYITTSAGGISCREYVSTLSGDRSNWCRNYPVIHLANNSLSTKSRDRSITQTWD